MSDGDLAALLVGEEYKKAKEVLMSKGTIKDDKNLLHAKKIVANVEALLASENRKYYTILFSAGYPLENPRLDPKDYEDVD